MCNLAVVGCGYWGPNLLRNFNSLPGCAVKLACDVSPQRLERMQALYPQLAVTLDFDDVFRRRDIDAAVIATPVRFHYAMARRCLESGVHTFIEKPMATSTAECRHLVDLAQARRLTVMVGHTFVYSPPVRMIKKIVQSGELGQIQYISSRRLNLGLYQQDINVAWDLAPHDISIILFVLDDVPVSVNCQGKAHLNPRIEDVTNMTLNFASGAFATIQSSWLDPNKVRDMTFVGSRKMLVYNDLEPNEKIKIYDKRVEVPPHYDTFGEFHYSYHYGDILSPYIKQAEPLKMEAQHFVDCIRKGCPPESCGVKGMEVVRILEAATESLQLNGARVDIQAPVLQKACGFAG